MHELIKHIWLLLLIIFVLGLLSGIPIGRYQYQYMNNLHEMRARPQQRVDATYKYVEAVEDGIENPTPTNMAKPPKKYYRNSIEPDYNNPPPRPSSPYSKPRYIRDKNNPQILHPYRGNYP